MESYYPEVLAQQAFIEKVIRNEEERFHETINEGLEILNQVIAKVKADGQETLAGADIFKLYDTYGFPVELTEEVAQDEGLKVDHAGFEKKWMHSGHGLVLLDRLSFLWVFNPLFLTDIKVESRFVGYESLEVNSELLVIIQEEQLLDTVTTGEAKLIFKETPFYAEMGGQVADTGTVVDQSGVIVAEITDVKKHQMASFCILRR